MPKAKQTPEDILVCESLRPALTEEGRESQIIAAAYDLAEKQIREGTASSQVITHFLKMGSVRGRLELENLKLEKQLIEAKTESLKSAKRSEELFEKAMAAFKEYNGQSNGADNIL